MGAMTRLYEERNMGIVEEDTFDLEREYETYYNEAKFMHRVQHVIGKFINNSKYDDPKERELANRALAARIGTQQAADKEAEVVMDTYKKYDKASKAKLINSHDNYVTKKHIENKYNYKLKRAEKDKAAQQPAADNKARQPKPTFRPAYA